MRDRYRVKRHLALRALLGALLGLLLPFAAAVPSERVPAPELIDLDPGHDAVLSSREPLYLRLRYRSATPIHILLSGSYRGDVVHGFRHDSAELFPAGNREVTVWLAYPSAARIDEVEVRILNANKARLAATTFPIEAEWTEANRLGAGADRQTKSWVAALTPEQRARMADRLSSAREPRGFDPFDLIFLCVPGYFPLQAVLTWRTSGRWRKASLVPAVIMVPILAITVLAFAAQSNLRPDRHPAAAPPRQGRVIGHARSGQRLQWSVPTGAVVHSGRAECRRHSRRAEAQACRPAQCANTRSVSRRMKAAATGPVAGPS